MDISKQVEALGRSVSEEPSETSFTLDDSQLPAIKDWKKGETYELKVTVKMTDQTKTKDGVSGDFDILDVEEDNDEEGADDKSMEKGDY